ncbi:hypothetical protein LSTR_LSTR008918 [Laodelphax striatellus]|uniref:Uncharacterized protein n=1 Tax=Laodelphax striatellus TaxID=195883 RepID=A0A482WLI3_LAOST|nr:hypothetical protein LSTR_LSTR008918 [Laodelphax striatellus]
MSHKRCPHLECPQTVYLALNQQRDVTSILSGERLRVAADSGYLEAGMTTEQLLSRSPTTWTLSACLNRQGMLLLTPTHILPHYTTLSLAPQSLSTSADLNGLCSTLPHHTAHNIPIS